LVSRKEIEELKEESQDFWRFMRGCGEAWKKTCYDMHGRIFKGALFGFTGSHYGTQGSIGYPRIRDAEGCTFHIGSYNFKKKKN